MTTPLLILALALTANHRVCECKFALDTFTIDKGCNTKLRAELATFREVVKTRESLLFTFITTDGVAQNQYMRR